MNQQYVVTLRAVIRAEDDIDAILIADQIKVNGEKDLDEEDGDSLDVVQVTTNALDISPEGQLVKLRQARNILIRSRVGFFIDAARELDKVIFVMKERMESNKGYELAGYDYGGFMERMREVLGGDNPIHE